MVMTYSATEKTGEQDYQGNVATYTYDRSGRVITANAPISGTLHYQYDAVGNTVAVTTTDSASGVPIQVQTQGYDALNRVITDTVTAPGGPTLTALTAYDKDGNVAQVEQPNGDVTYNTYVASPRARRQAPGAYAQCGPPRVGRLDHRGHQRPAHAAVPA